jgi:hypothetical protein
MTSEVRARRVRWPALLFGLIVVLTSIAFVGCSEQGSAEQMSSPVAITTRSTTVSIENRAGQPLTDVKLIVVPFGKPEYSKSLVAMSVAERRDVPLGDLTNAEGTRFNAMLVRPKLVRVTATDPAGKQYEVELPWR